MASEQTTPRRRDAGVFVPMGFCGSVLAVGWIVVTLFGRAGSADVASEMGVLAVFCFGILLGQLMGR